MWASVLEEVKHNVGDQRFSLWFSNLRPLKLEGEVITLGVPNLFVQDWLQTHFLDILRQALAKQVGQPPDVRFHIDPALFQKSREKSLEAHAEIVADGAAQKTAPTRPASRIRGDFTLKNYIVGSSNKLAYACALEILDSSSNRLQPLFIHSLSGLGKTHLLQAIWHEMRERGDGRNAEYLSAEAFTNQFIYAMRSRRLDAFRHRYRSVDVLLIDDVHFLSNKHGLQEEILHTYDALDGRSKQLVFASDVHPKMLMYIKQGLANRFASGMVVRMGPPDFSMRVAILKAKLYQQRRRVPEEVLRYVSRGFSGNIRELSGALTSILAYASLSGEKVDVSLARTVLSRLGQPENAGASGMGAVESVVARHYAIKPSAWRARKQTRATRLPRQVCMYLARQCTPLSCREIAQHFGSKNHSTVVSAVKRVEATIKKDRDLAELISAMIEEIKKA